MMDLQRALLYSFFIISIISSYNCSQEDPLDHNHLEEQASGYDSQAYPSYVGDGEFEGLIKLQSDVLGLQTLSEGGSKSIPVKTIDVNDSGEEDDTEVRIFFFFVYSQASSTYIYHKLNNMNPLILL